MVSPELFLCRRRVFGLDDGRKQLVFQSAAGWSRGFGSVIRWCRARLDPKQ